MVIILSKSHVALASWYLCDIGANFITTITRMIRSHLPNNFGDDCDLVIQEIICS